VKVGAKAGTSGKIFGSVNAIQVAEALKAQHNVEVDRKKITVEDIKEIGTFTAKANLHRDVKVEFVVEVVAE
jgi:large subunit ribosomal protein L9